MIGRRSLLAWGCAMLIGCGAAQRPDGGEGLLPIGAAAPDLSGIDQAGKTIRLREVAPPVIVFFYPKDGTPGCTEEACAFRDAWDRFSEVSVTVIGVSSQDQESHAGFAREHSLPFSLVADTEGRWGAAFGVGSFLGMYSRVSFLVGMDRTIAKVYPDVDPGLHADRVLNDAAALPK